MSQLTPFSSAETENGGSKAESGQRTLQRQYTDIEKKNGSHSLMKYYVTKHSKRMDLRQFEEVQEEDDQCETFESEDFSDDDSTDLAYRKVREEKRKAAEQAAEPSFGDYIHSQISGFFEGPPS